MFQTNASFYIIDIEPFVMQDALEIWSPTRHLNDILINIQYIHINTHTHTHVKSVVVLVLTIGFRFRNSKLHLIQSTRSQINECMNI